MVLDERVGQSNLDERLSGDAEPTGLLMNLAQQVDGEVHVDTLNCSTWANRLAEVHVEPTRSTPESCMASSRSAESALVLEVRCFFFIACSPDGDDANPVASVRDERRPHQFADAPGIT